MQKNTKKFIGFFLFFILLFADVRPSSFFNAKRVDYNQLSLFEYLNKHKDILLQKNSDQNNSILSSVKNQILLNKLSDAISKIKSIMISFKNDKLFYNLEIQLKFLKLSSYLKDINSVKPSDLRGLRAIILKYSQYIEKYVSARKNLLKKADLTLLNDIQELNNLLLNDFLGDKLEKFSFKDKALDVAFYKPMEVAKKNRAVVVSVLTTALIVGAIFTIGYFKSLFSKPKKELPQKPDFVIKNLEQFEVVKQKDGSSCGYHAVLAAIAFGVYPEKKDLEEKLKKLPEGLIDDAKKLIKERRLKAAERRDASWWERTFRIDDRYLKEDEIRWLLSRENIGLWNKYFKDDCDNIEGVLNKITILGEISTLEDGYGYTDEIVDNVYVLRNDGEPQYVILNPIARNKGSNKSNSRDRVGHWFFAKISKDDNSDDFQIWVTDSLGVPRNKCRFTNRVIDFYTKKIVPTSSMLKFEPMFNSFEHILTTQDDLDEDANGGRTQRVLKKFNEIINSIIVGDENGSFLTQEVFVNLYKDRLEMNYNLLKQLDDSYKDLSFDDYVAALSLQD